MTATRMTAATMKMLVPDAEYSVSVFFESNKRKQKQQQNSYNKSSNKILKTEVVLIDKSIAFQRPQPMALQILIIIHWLLGEIA